MNENVLVFDGVCVLCNRWVAFVLRRDRHRLYKFAAMQTPTGRALLSAHGLDPDDPLSFLLLEGGRGYTDTDGIVRVLRSFGGVWSTLASIIGFLPRSVRDSSYRWIARHRYRLFGRHEACMLPAPHVVDRFLN